MENKKRVTIGILTILLLISGVVYITFNDSVKIRVDDDKSTFYVQNDNGRWVVAGREYVSLFDGASKMNRRLSGITVETTINNVTGDVFITRTTPYIRGPVVVDRYHFNGNIHDIELFPISHDIDVYNASGYFLRYEVRDLTYSGDTYELVDETVLSFGRNMKVELNHDYRWAWVYKTGIVKAQYDILTDDESYNVRLFDPPGEVHYEYLDGGSILRIWNDNDEYFINVSSGIQLTNHYDDYWTKNVFCGGRWSGSEWLDFCNDAIPFIWNLESDNETYVYYVGYYEFSYGGKDLRFTLNYTLFPDDERIMIGFDATNIGKKDIPESLRFLWKIEDIQTSMDVENDVVYVNRTNYLLNQSLDLLFTDLSFNESIKDSFINIYDNKTYQYTQLDWDADLNYSLSIKSDVTQYNAPITLGLTIGSLVGFESTSTVLYWIDKDKEVTAVTLHAPTEDPAIFVDGTFTMTCSWTEGGAGTALPNQEITWQYDEGTPGSYVAIPASGGGLSTPDSTQVIDNAVPTDLTITGDIGDEYYVRCADVGFSVYSTAQVVTVSEPTYGHFTITTTDPTDSPFNVSIYNTFDVNVTATCIGGSCGAVDAFLRYNLSSADPDTPVNTTTADIPLFVVQREASVNNFFDDAELGSPADFGWAGGTLTYATDFYYTGSKSIKEASNNVGSSTSLNMSGYSFPMEITYHFYDSAGTPSTNRRWWGSWDSADGPHYFQGAIYSYLATSTTKYLFIHPNSTGAIIILGTDDSIGWHKVRMQFPNESGVKLWLDDGLVYENGDYLIPGPRGDTRNMNLSHKSQLSALPVWFDNVTTSSADVFKNNTIRFPAIAEDETARATWKVNYRGEPGSSYMMQVWYNGSDASSSNNTDFIVQNISGPAGDPDTNASIWTGSEWVDMNYSIGGESISFSCSATQTECEPLNQNVGGGQSIYLVENNGTGSGTSIVMRMNATVPNIALLCDDDGTYAGATTLTTSYQTIHDTIAADASVDVYCWADYNSPTSGAPFKVFINITA